MTDHTALPPSKVIIVVEDEETIRLEAIMVLEQAGLDVKAFDNVDAAADYLDDHPGGVHAIFFDIMLVGVGNGIGLAEIAAAIAPEVRLVATSGNYEEAPEKLPPGAVFLKKPWRATDIVAALMRPGRSG